MTMITIVAMKATRHHHPGEPASDEPPEGLVDLVDRLDDPLVVHAGITTTQDGRWALHVTVPGETEVPVRRIERIAKGFPVVYEAALSELPVARPAFPGLGE